MKQKGQRKKILCIVLILSVILLMFLLVIQFSKLMRDHKTQIPEQTEEASEEESQTEETRTENSEEGTSTEETRTEVSEEKAQGYIIIGDSHAVVADGMGYSIYGSDVEGVVLNKNLFIVHTGLDPVMGTIDWLEGDGTDRMTEIISEHQEISQWNIISMHGTSMVVIPDIAARYIENYRKWIDETFRGCNVYIVSVPPLDEAEWVIRHPDMPERSNQDIIQFNEKIREVFPDIYFDYYDWFLERASFQDEIHYTGETYREMFDEIIAQIQ